MSNTTRQNPVGATLRGASGRMRQHSRHPDTVTAGAGVRTSGDGARAVGAGMAGGAEGCRRAGGGRCNGFEGFFQSFRLLFTRRTSAHTESPTDCRVCSASCGNRAVRSGGCDQRSRTRPGGQTAFFGCAGRRRLRGVAARQHVPGAGRCATTTIHGSLAKWRPGRGQGCYKPACRHAGRAGRRVAAGRSGAVTQGATSGAQVPGRRYAVHSSQPAPADPPSSAARTGRRAARSAPCCILEPGTPHERR